MIYTALSGHKVNDQFIPDQVYGPFISKLDAEWWGSENLEPKGPWTIRALRVPE